MGKAIKYFIGLTLCLTFISCNKTPDDISLSGKWELVEFTNKQDGETYSLPPGFTAGITFTGQDSLIIKGPCNEGGASFINKDSNISIDQVGITERACEISEYESTFIDNLSGEYSIDGDELRIISDFDTDLIFRKVNSISNSICINTNNADLVIDSIPCYTYYSDEIFDSTDLNLYGKWELTKTFSGFGGYSTTNLAFDYLEVKKFGIHAAIKGDSLYGYGKITIEGKDQLFGYTIISFGNEKVVNPNFPEPFYFDHYSVQFYNSDSISLSGSRISDGPSFYLRKVQ